MNMRVSSADYLDLFPVPTQQPKLDSSGLASGVQSGGVSAGPAWRGRQGESEGRGPQQKQFETEDKQKLQRWKN